MYALARLQIVRRIRCARARDLSARDVTIIIIIIIKLVTLSLSLSRRAVYPLYTFARPRARTRDRYRGATRRGRGDLVKELGETSPSRILSPATIARALSSSQEAVALNQRLAKEIASGN